MANKKELSNVEHNDLIFASIRELNDKIAELKTKLKPIEMIKTATLAECNAMTKKSKMKG